MTDIIAAALIADIGGTHARFALLLPDDTIDHVVVINHANDEADCADVCQRYLDTLPTPHRVTRAAWAVAGPVTPDGVLLTNRGWNISRSALQATFGWTDFIMVNDFAALALAVPHLTDADTILIKSGVADKTAPCAIVGPGTGLGVAGLVPMAANEWRVLPAEGGHVALPAVNATERDLLAQLALEFGYVAAEYVLSGRGLVNLARAMQSGAPYQTPHEIVAAALQQPADPQAKAVLEQFCAFLGTVAGDAALVLGARGGVYLAGGILPKMVEILQNSPFIARFQDKQAVAAYMQAIPVWLITHPLPAFIGLQALLKTNGFK